MEKSTNNKTYKSGFIAILGSPNVGKSTLLNALVGEKIAIVSPKPQTTRNRIIGVKSKPSYQMVFLDTPGLHKPRTELGNFMIRSIKEAMVDVDLLLLIVDTTAVRDQDRNIVKDIGKRREKKILLLNKIDLIQKEDLLPYIEEFKNEGYDEIIPISAKKKDGLSGLEDTILKYLKEGPKYFPDDMITDQPERLIVGELIREKALKYLQEEIPHGVGIEILSMKMEEKKRIEIFADIYCEKESHKRIIIGKQGSMLKQIGRSARMDIEKFLGTNVNLQLWVKVRQNWRDNKRDLKTLGYSKQ